MKDFTLKVIKNLEANGFPLKKVSLPTEKMFEIADDKGFSFNAVIDLLKSEHSIDAQITAEKIIFTKAHDQENMFQKAQEMMSKMSPEDLQKMQETIMNMSEEERTELMKKGKDLGLV